MIVTQWHNPKDEDEEYPDEEGVVSLDHRECDPDTMLMEFDKQLKAHGLQIEMFDYGGDEYTWRIVSSGME